MDANELKTLQNELKEDSKFFQNYRDKFLTKFLKRIENPGLLSIQAIETIVRRIYLLFFHFQPDYDKLLFELFYKLFQNRSDIKKAFINTYLELIRDYINYLISKGANLKKAAVFFKLTSFYLSIIEEAYEMYVKKIEEEALKAKKKTEEIEKHIIIDFFKKLVSDGKIEAELLTYYQEMPISCKSKIISLDDQELKIKAEKACIASETGEIYFKHENLPKVVRLKIKEREADIFKCEIIGFSELPQERRKFLRVVPKDPIPIKIKKGDFETIGTIADISVGGVGIHVRNIGNLKVNDKVEIRFNLPQGTINTSAQIRYIVLSKSMFKEGIEAYRIGLQYWLSFKEEEKVSDFVMKRQLEILAELKDSLFH